MKKLLFAVALLIATTVSAQEKYYGQIKNVTKTKGKSSTQVSTMSATIDEEYKDVAISTSSTDERLRYKIVEQTLDEKTGLTTYKLTLLNGEGTVDAIISANTEKAIFENLKTGKKLTFDSRSRPSIRIN
jgi:hypothetical protein